MARQLLTNLSISELRSVLYGFNQPEFRHRQILKWVYQKRVESFDLMSNLSGSLQKEIEKNFSLEKLHVKYLLESEKGDAVKFGFESGGEIIESVLLYDGKRRTLCVSSQIGCALGCVYCETGKVGFVRNLTQHEIIGQLIAANSYLDSRSDKHVTNVVFMGMGEALSNFDAFLSSVRIIMNENCFGIGKRKITVSTAGVIPSIEKLLRTDLGIKLAISLNSFNNRHRSSIMPVNRTYPIENLVDAAYNYARQTGTRVTFEYVVVSGENDSEEAAISLVRLLKIPCKINLIPINPCSAAADRTTDHEGLNRFAKKLVEKGLSVTVRKSRGRDICGACGQLSAKKNTL